MIPKLIIIVPCYNEEKVLPITSEIFLKELELLINKNKISKDSQIMFVNDGSYDNTWQIIQNLSNTNNHYIGISQSKNRGHQSSILAGLMESKDICDITITIDCDGQDDIKAIEQMIDCYKNGAEVVYGVRKSRDSDSFFKKNSAQLFYKMMKKLGADIIYNHADYRLISSKVLKEFENFKEVNLFLRGIIPLIGFKSECIYYERKERIAGKSHYPLKKMIALAIDGITSLSIKPIRLITVMGITVSILGFIGIIWAIISQINGTTVWGWASLVCIICFLGGIQLISIGIIGEYIGKIYLETKQRPRYIISEKTENFKK